MKIKKNDTVLIISGKDSGKTGKVLRALPSDNRIVVDGVNVQKKHQKARSAKETSGIVEQAGPIDASNALVVCPACGKAARVGYTVADGKKVRVCGKCKAVLDVKESKADDKKAAKKTTKTAKAKADKADKPAKKTTKKSKVEEA